MSSPEERQDLSLALDALFAISTLQPISQQSLASTLDVRRDRLAAALALLRGQELVTTTTGQTFYTTAAGTQRIAEAGLRAARDARDVSRMLYLWNRQHGSGHR
jgi:hypothetical protein